MARVRRLSQVGEFGWLKKLIPRLYWPSSLHPQLCIGPGDDAGVLRISSGRVLVATTDTLVEGIHFERKWTSPQDLGEKLLAVNLSDFAAMGHVKPLAALVTLALPGDTPVNFVNNFYQGLKSCAHRWKVGFLGGDTVGSRRDWVVSVTLLGEANPHELVRRKGAQRGDFIAVIGPLGMAAAGLEVLKKGNKQAWTAPLIEAFWRPQPQLRAGAILGQRRLASSLIDSSDGLEASLKLLADASRLGVTLELASISVNPSLKRWANGRGKNPLHYVFLGGEDYALVFTVNPRDWSAVQRLLPKARKIGRMVAPGKGISLKSYGFAHF